MQNVQIGDKRSAPLEASDKKNLKAVLKYAGTKVAAAALMGIGRNTCFQLMNPGIRTCAPETLKKIREFFDANPSVVGQSMAAA